MKSQTSNPKPQAASLVGGVFARAAMINRAILIALLALFTTLPNMDLRAQTNVTALRSYAHETPAQHDARMQWWTDARFGMFIHWGPYAVLGGEYQGKRVNWISEWIQHSGRIPAKEYEDVAASFNPVKFDARQWVKLAKDAGMKYIAITSKHHDGFCMWDSQLTDYNITKWTPFKRNVIAELANECEKQGLKFGVYYSVRDWHHPDWALRYAQLEKPNSGWGYRASPWTKGHVAECGCPSCRKNIPITPEMNLSPVENADMNRYLDYMKGQLTELLTQCGPVSLMWFDAQDIQDPKLGRVDEMIATMRHLQPKLIISDRIGPDGTMFGDYGVHEGNVPGSGAAREWETCMTLNDTWGYSKFDEKWKSAEKLVHTLVETTSKNGNFLLNIGPDGEGVIPQGSADRLKEVGEWMAVNGQSIYGCGASSLPSPKWGKITVKGKTVYLHVFNWPVDQQLTIKNFNGPAKRAYLLADVAKQSLLLKTAGEVLSIQVPAKAPNSIDSVIVLEL